MNFRSTLGLLLLLLAITCLCGLWADGRYFTWSLVLSGVISLGLLWPWAVVRSISANAVLRQQRAQAGDLVELEIQLRNCGILTAWGLRILPHPSLPAGAVLPPVWPWQSRVVVVTLMPASRGWFPSEPLTVTTRFPFDLCGKTLIIPLARILVWPRAVEMAKYGPQNMIATIDSDLACRSAASGAVCGMRHYRSGDHMRQISWRHVAKIERLVVRESEDPLGISYPIVIDTTLPAAFEDSLCVAAGFAMLLKDEPVGLCCGNLFISPGRGPLHTNKILDALALAQVTANAHLGHHDVRSIWIGPESESPVARFIRSPLEGIVIALPGAGQGRLAASA